MNVESFAQLVGFPKIRNILRVEQRRPAPLRARGPHRRRRARRAGAGPRGERGRGRHADVAGHRRRPRASPYARSCSRRCSAPRSASSSRSRSPSACRSASRSARRACYDLDVGYPRRLVRARSRDRRGARGRARDRARVGALGGQREAIRDRVAVDRRCAGRRAAGSRPRSSIGSRLAVEPGRGRRAVPVRSALIGAIVGVLGVVGCFTFRAGLADAAASPQRSGIVWNFAFGSGEGQIPAPKLAAIAKDRDVAGFIRGALGPQPSYQRCRDTDVGDRDAEGRHDPRRARRSRAARPRRDRVRSGHVARSESPHRRPHPDRREAGPHREGRGYRARPRVVAHRLRPERVDDGPRARDGHRTAAKVPDATSSRTTGS